MNEDDYIIDLTGAIENLEDMPLCPLCDQPLDYWEVTRTFKAHGYIALAHIQCIANERERLGV